jgi:hypothetical protein
VEDFILAFDFLFERFFHFGRHLLFVSKVFENFNSRENKCNYNQDHPEVNHPSVAQSVAFVGKGALGKRKDVNDANKVSKSDDKGKKDGSVVGHGLVVRLVYKNDKG